MSLSSKVIMSFLAGMFSAMLAWVVIDFNGYFSLSNLAEAQSFSELFSQQAILGALFGAFVGTAIGCVSGVSGGSNTLVVRNAAWGGAVGLIGGLLGLFFGQMFFGALYVNPNSLPSMALGPLVFIWDVLVRAIGWALIGMFLGVAQGMPSKSKKAMRHGALGGLIGGLLGGTLFEIVPYILPPGTKNPGVISRGISLAVTGASIGLFIGLVELLLKQAWIRVVQGRNEGREYVITKPRTTIGRDELSDIGLFGDRNIQPLHAVVEIRNNQYVFVDAGTQLGTSVNGQRVREQALRDGDVIQIGSMQLEFHDKATASKIPRQVDAASKPPVQIPAREGICPFCGGVKDPKTGACACSVGAQPVGQSPYMPNAPTAAPTVMPTSGQGPRLVGIGGQYAGQSFPLSPSVPTTVGREPGRDIQLMADTTVSRSHARIENEGGGFVVYDEGSSNGTMVNGAPVSRQPISPGDTVHFGSSVFRYEL